LVGTDVFVGRGVSVGRSVGGIGVLVGTDVFVGRGVSVGRSVGVIRVSVGVSGVLVAGVQALVITIRNTNAKDID